jgi:O-methyltransferase involved in polyketide biosynthesis
MYISPPAVDILLAFISKNSGPESTIIADFFDTSVVDGTCSLKEACALRQFVESEDAPLQFGISPEMAEDFFATRGFRIITLINAVSCKDKYFSGINRNRNISPMFNFVYAGVLR